MRRRYVTLDVFTDRRFTGNPLAVVLDAEGPGRDAMQAIAREFNLAETVFVCPPQGIGPVPCATAAIDHERGRARFQLARLPEPHGEPSAHETIATALGLAPEEIGFDDFRPSRLSAGVPGSQPRRHQALPATARTLGGSIHAMPP